MKFKKKYFHEQFTNCKQICSKVCEIGATTAKSVSYKYTPKDKLSSTHVCDVSIYPQIKQAIYIENVGRK